VIDKLEAEIAGTTLEILVSFRSRSLLDDDGFVFHRQVFRQQFLEKSFIPID